MSAHRDANAFLRRLAGFVTHVLSTQGSQTAAAISSKVSPAGDSNVSRGKSVLPADRRGGRINRRRCSDGAAAGSSRLNHHRENRGNGS
jgi:hypothetical protein